MQELTLSASKIIMMTDCFGKYYFRYIKGLKKENIYPGTLFGKAIHKIAEEALKLKLSEDDNTIYERFKNRFDEYYLKMKVEETKSGDRTFCETRDYDEQTYIQSSNKIANTFLKFILKYFNTYWIKSIHNEKQVEGEYDLLKIEGVKLKLNGFVDLMIEGEDGYDIYDFKTTKHSSKFYCIEWDKDIQSLIYLYLLNKEYNKLGNSFSYIVLNQDEKVLFSQTKIINGSYEKMEDRFHNLTSMLTNCVYLHMNGTQDDYKPEQQKCNWCKDKKYCNRSPFKYKRIPKDVKQMLDEKEIKFDV